MLGSTAPRFSDVAAVPGIARTAVATTRPRALPDAGGGPLSRRFAAEPVRWPQQQ